MDASELDKVVDWLSDGARSAKTPAALPEQTCGRLISAGVPLPVGETVKRFRFGVALHVGRVLYGNIGGGNGLDFTCVGPAVNLADWKRWQADCTGRSWPQAPLSRPVPVDLDQFPITGFSMASRVYGMRDEAGTQTSQSAVQSFGPAMSSNG